ncbi:MAG: tripartite tricarboxylate transporter TctB family protein [Candidatus Sumerlaeia bacterium]|nr:tripartite tricarboxylate transporter TctB family protein [Candidatus Sumerlaeia bacterium]
MDQTSGTAHDNRSDLHDGDQATQLSMKSLRDKDVLFALCLIVGSASTLVYALHISFEAMKAVNAEFYTAPGFFVLIIAAALLILGSSLLRTALRQGGSLGWLLPRRLVASARTQAFRQTFTAFAYLFLYMVLFWQPVPGWGAPMPFWLNTVLFLGLMMITFARIKPGYIVVISVLTTLAVDGSFRWLLHVPLP